MPTPALNPTVGPITSPDGGETGLRSGRDRELIIGDAGKGRYYEQTRLQNVWTLSTPLAGIVVTANMLTSVASHNGIGLYNPTGSGKNLAILRAVVVVVTGTMATGGAFVWGCVPTSTSITGAGVTTMKNNYTMTTTPTPVGRGYDGSVAVTGSAVSNIFRVFGGGPAGAAVIGSNMTFEEIVDGDIVAKPDTFIGLFGLVAATTLTIYASITWTEIAI